MNRISRIEPEAAELLKTAANILDRRRLRPNFFDRQFFGEQSWELLLHLYVAPKGWISISDAARALQVSETTATAILRLLTIQGLTMQADSDGGWDRIPIALTDAGRENVRGYLRELIATRLAA